MKVLLKMFSLTKENQEFALLARLGLVAISVYSIRVFVPDAG
jgi:hypothetical protein